ncbi:hypothetical protein A2Z00_02835 [Candidatus Gottesmanbacteria bacterium RBG_13_45_10]|uniref:Major facilitator superfamily (MFS) profile domain-containing protein n=1 Tax=Candidatus Gottesmanbacteria bacterium RBG_13_45_10 TaxID=1798370 RepID=A0A1F5ZG36_9BACT|nr:MAG: hypothetical protein A2Z00_02835 [Candidatus Gottesmanbacteria bacterium RBG_13_45_10]
MKSHANNTGNRETGESTYAQVLRIVPFRSLWFGQIFSQIAVNTLLFVLALRVYQLTSSNTAVSGLFLAYGIPSVLFGMVAGTLVDHLDKRRVLMLCDATRAVFVIALLFLSQNVLVIYVLTFCNAVVTQLYVPSEGPTIPQLVPGHLLVSANSLFSFTFYSSLAVGSILAGPLLRWFGPQGIFLLIAAFYLIAAWNVSRLPPQNKGALGFYHILNYEPRRLFIRVWRELIDGIRYVSQSPKLFDSLFLLTGTQIILVLLASLGPGFADKVLGIDVRDASLYMVGPAVLGIVLGAIWVGTVGYRYSAQKLIRTGVLAAGIILLVISLAVRLHRIPQFEWFLAPSVILPFGFVMFFLLGVANSFLDVPANTMLQEEAQGSMRGRVYGMLTAFVGGVGILPVVLGGILADVIGVGKVVFALGIGVVAYGLWRVRYNRRNT